MNRAMAIVADWVRRPRRHFLSGTVIALTVLGCAGSSEPAAQPRYPEKRRPPPLRSASDGEIMGADQISPEDRLEASPTNEHPAAGWVVEDGKLVPEKEARHRAQAHERSGFAAEGKAGSKSEPDCDPTAPADPAAPAAPPDGRKRKPPCPPSAPPAKQP